MCHELQAGRLNEFLPETWRVFFQKYFAPTHLYKYFPTLPVYVCVGVGSGGVRMEQCYYCSLHYCAHASLIFTKTLRVLPNYKKENYALYPWLVPHQTAANSVHPVYTIQPCTMSLHAKSHTEEVCMFSCNLPTALLAE